MLLLLFTFASSIWWEFSIAGIRSKIRNSREKPLFLLLYNRYCPHCHGLPEGLKKYSEGLGNRDDIYISSVDCFEGYGCSFFRIQGTPTMYLILGTEEEYWPVSPERGPEGWDRWINESLNYSLTEINSSEELNQRIDNYTDGGSIFLLETPSIDHKYFTITRELSRFYKHYHDLFLYKVDKSLKYPKITAYTSKYCHYEYHGSAGRIEKFINRHKFGVLHKYLPTEYSSIGRSNAAAVILNNGPLFGSQIQSLHKISRDHCNIDYGYIDIEQNTDALKQLRANSNDVPFLAGYGKLSGTKSIYKGKISDAWKSGFMNKVLKHNSGNILKSLISRIEMIHILYMLIIILIVMIGVLVFLIVEICRYNNINAKREL